jgi:glucosamine--fructose-6-phosphate aminotransferase (isomerizing)
MEYRGYDSSGIAILDGTGGVEIERKAGKLANLEAELGEYGADHFVGTSGMGHTRWATHGRPTDRNAHPHRDASGKLAVVHNGIIENFAPLRAELEAAGVELQSDTDSEVAVHLVARAYAQGPTAGDFIESALSVVRRLEGAVKLGSDVAAFIEHTRDAVELGQDQAVVITADSYRISDFAGNEAEGRPFRIDWDLAAAEKGGHDYFMLKEIEEQPTAVADTLLGHFENGKIVLDEQRLSDQELRDVDKVFVVACGSAYHSGLLAKYAIEHWTRLPVEVELASEFRYRDPVLDRSTLVVAISQSGETADTLEAVKHAKDQKARVLAICNTNGAQIPREADAVLYTRAGPEIAVASTKAFLAQSTVLFLGRHVGYPVALEGALKLKELAYMHAEGFAAGELKHGPIALIEEDLPVIIVMPSPQGRAVLHSKLVSNIQEIKARGATTIVIAEEGDTVAAAHADHLIEIPASPTLLQPLLSTVPLQIFAAEVAAARGYDVDKPRNLAKSVTVE